MATKRKSSEQDDSRFILKIKFNKTAMCILIPFLISMGVFIVELYSIYHIPNNSLAIVDFLHLLNTCFIPTHIATATTFLYELYSSLQREYFDLNNNAIKMEVIKSDKVGFTIITTIVIGFLYVLCNVSVTCLSQFILLIFQIAYMIYLYVYGVGSKVIGYREIHQIRNVLMSE